MESTQGIFMAIFWGFLTSEFRAFIRSKVKKAHARQSVPSLMVNAKLFGAHDASSKFVISKIVGFVNYIEKIENFSFY